MPTLLSQATRILSDWTTVKASYKSIPAARPIPICGLLAWEQLASWTSLLERVTAQVLRLGEQPGLQNPGKEFFFALKPSLVALISPDLTFVDSERKVSATVFMRRCFSFWIHWLLLAVIFSGAFAIVPPGVLSGSKTQSATLVFGTTHQGHSDKLFY